MVDPSLAAIDIAMDAADKLPQEGALRMATRVGSRVTPLLGAASEGYQDWTYLQSGQLTAQQTYSRVMAAAEIGVAAAVATDVMAETPVVVGLGVLGVAAAPVWVPVAAVVVVGGVAAAGSYCSCRTLSVPIQISMGRGDPSTWEERSGPVGP